MKEKLTIFIIIFVTIIVLVIAWFWIQNIIEDYDLDRAMMENIIEEKEAYVQSLTEKSLQINNTNFADS